MPDNINLKKYVDGVNDIPLYPKTTWAQVLNTPLTYPPTAHTHPPTDLTRGDVIYYVVGNTGGTAGTWTGTITGIAAYYDGLTIAYKIGTAGASTTTLNINSLGAKTVRRNTGNLTTHLPVDSVAILVYTTVSGTGYWVWSDYDSATDYNMAWIYTGVAGDAINPYKIVMEGIDGKYYPLTTTSGTGTTKTITTADLKLGGYILWFYSSGTVASGAVMGNYVLYQQQQGSVFTYTANSSSWTVNYPIYLKGTIQSNGAFRLDNTSYTSFMTQTLPTTDDGFVYIQLGMKSSANGDAYFLLTQDHPAYIYKNGKLCLYSGYSGNAGLLEGHASSYFETAITAGSSAQYWRGDKTWQTLDKTAVGLGNVANIAQVTSVGGTSPISSSGGTTPTISVATGYTIPTSTEKTNYDTAYGWGNHAGLYSALGHNHTGVYEPVITKLTAFNKNYGTTATDVKMNGVQAVGSVDAIARIDHVHPVDTSRSPVAGSASITIVGTIATGTWQGTVVGSAYGGTGVNNGGRTLTIATNSGTIAFTNASSTLTVAANASVSGTNTGDQTSVSGNAGTATKLETARNLAVALGSTTAVTFDGSGNQTSIPVSGILGVANGGTGQSTAITAADLGIKSARGSLEIDTLAYSSVISATVSASSYYKISVTGYWWRINAITAHSCRLSFTVNNATGATVYGAWQFQALDSSTGLTVTRVYTASATAGTAGTLMTTPSATTDVSSGFVSLDLFVYTGSATSVAVSLSSSVAAEIVGFEGGLVAVKLS